MDLALLLAATSSSDDSEKLLGVLVFRFRVLCLICSKLTGEYKESFRSHGSHQDLDYEVIFNVDIILL